MGEANGNGKRDWGKESGMEWERERERENWLGKG